MLKQRGTTSASPTTEARACSYDKREDQFVKYVLPAAISSLRTVNRTTIKCTVSRCSLCDSYTRKASETWQRGLRKAQMKIWVEEYNWIWRILPTTFKGIGAIVVQSIIGFRWKNWNIATVQADVMRLEEEALVFKSAPQLAFYYHNYA